MDEQLNVIKHKALSTALDLHGVAIADDKVYIVEIKANSIGIYDLQNDMEKEVEIKYF